MRRILTDDARARRAHKRNGEVQAAAIEDVATVRGEQSLDVLAVDRALLSLAGIDQRKAKIVELRYFGGLTVDETARVLGVSAETVHRDWRVAKAWLLRELS